MLRVIGVLDLVSLLAKRSGCSEQLSRAQIGVDVGAWATIHLPSFAGQPAYRDARSALTARRFLEYSLETFRRTPETPRGFRKISEASKQNH